LHPHPFIPVSCMLYAVCCLLYPVSWIQQSGLWSVAPGSSFYLPPPGVPGSWGCPDFSKIPSRSRSRPRSRPSQSASQPVSQPTILNIDRRVASNRKGTFSVRVRDFRCVERVFFHGSFDLKHRDSA